MYQNLLELEVNTLAGARRSAHKNDELRKGLIASSPSEGEKNFNNKACHLFLQKTVYKFMQHSYSNRNHMDLWGLQGSGDLHIQKILNQNITQILLFLHDLLLFYQAFSVNLSFNRCGMFVAGGVCPSVRYCASTRTYSVFTKMVHTTLPTLEGATLCVPDCCYLDYAVSRPPPLIPPLPCLAVFQGRTTVSVGPD